MVGCHSKKNAPQPVKQPATSSRPSVTTSICAGPLVTVRSVVDQGTTYFHVSPHGEITTDEPAVIRFASDLNGDGHEDIALNYGACGSLHECVLGVYIYCAPTKYAVVISPRYFYELEAEASVPGQWARLISTGRIDKHELAQPISLVFDGTQYREEE